MKFLTILQIKALSYKACADILEENDANGCYQLFDQISEFGCFDSLSVMQAKVFCLHNCLPLDDATDLAAKNPELFKSENVITYKNEK